MFEKIGLKINIKGIVQGVGFRPFVYSVAKKNGLTGWVRNSSKGVEIEIFGEPAGVERFLEEIKNFPPPLSRIDNFTSMEISNKHYVDFSIVESITQDGEFLPISPDYSICADCLNELFSPQDHRFRYPFINCTNCGPRFTIIKDIPYDRPFTTMSPFKMCDFCRAEYKNPFDRRYHAQPVACQDCGPQVSLIIKDQVKAIGDEAIHKAQEMIKEGKILAIKGLGGYHLACDATNYTTVDKLRTRKKRSDKPFALMAFSEVIIQNYCHISQEESRLIHSKERPIVLLNTKTIRDLSPLIAPNQNYFGFMLPYTPLHYLLLEPGTDIPAVWVMTSGNVSDEPIAFEDQQAFSRLGQIADGFLIHNREIHMRLDDSVSRIINEKPYLIRRSRGYAPDPIRTSYQLPQILATGAELKNTFCLSRDHYAFISHHIGDMENYETLKSFEEAIMHYKKLFRVEPEFIASDMHPDYLASRFAQQFSERENIPNIKVQHHHAHLAACLADNCWEKDEPVIGLCYDGTGYGTDGAIWGGEILVGNYAQYQRKYHLKYVPLPGGDISIRIPARMALAYLWQYQLDWDLFLPSVAALCMEDKTVLEIQLSKKINTPYTSSMGRLFDAIASLIGIKHKVNYEGQAAIEMEALVDPYENGYYSLAIEKDIIDPKPMFEAIISDLHNKVSKNTLAAKFHNSIVQNSVEICKNIRDEMNINTVALSGGVWQNRILLISTIKKLKNERFDVMIHKNVPANDGGISLGQILVTSFYLKNN